MRWNQFSFCTWSISGRLRNWTCNQSWHFESKIKNVYRVIDWFWLHINTFRVILCLEVKELHSLYIFICVVCLRVFLALLFDIKYYNTYVFKSYFYPFSVFESHMWCLVFPLPHLRVICGSQTVFKTCE